MAHETLPPPQLATGRFAGRLAFMQLVRDAVACAAAQGWNELVFCDAGFEDWPLHERVVTDAMNAWSKSGRRFTMIARQYDAVLRDKPRFVTWRGTWGHIVECRTCKQIDNADFPSLLWSPVWALQRLDLVHATGISSDDARRRTQIRELVDELLVNSSPGFPATFLGL